MNIKQYIQSNPFRVMGVFSNDTAGILSSNYSRMKAFAAIGKDVTFSQDMESVFSSKPDRKTNSLSASIAAISSPEGRLNHGLFWFMKSTATDAKALAVLAREGNLLEARQIWEEGEQTISSLQNQLMCCLLKDPRSYSKALQLALSLYTQYAHDFILTVSNGFCTITPEMLMPIFLSEIVKAYDGKCCWWDKAVKRLGNEAVCHLWSEAKATLHITKLQNALNVAKTTEIHSAQDNYDIAFLLMKQAEPHLKALKTIMDSHSLLLSRYATIADTVCEEILNREIAYYNHIGWFSGKTDKVLVLERFCYRYAATVRFKDRCRLNINITMGRKEDAPLFPNGMPDKLLSEYERKKRDAGISAILSGLMDKHGYTPIG